MTETIAGIDIPDTELAREATELVRKASTPLLFDHSRRVFLFASLKGRYRKIEADPELLYVGAMFHDLGLTEHYRRTAHHSPPRVTNHLEPEPALVRLGVEADVLGMDLDQITTEEIAAVVAAHPRPDFKNNILRAFYDGMKDRPDTTFGTMNDDVLAHFAPGFTREDFVDIITGSAWPA